MSQQTTTSLTVNGKRQTVTADSDTPLLWVLREQLAQTESSIVYGLGLALMERITIEDGAVKQSNFFDYHVPRMRDVPGMHIKLIQTPNHSTGAGQMATPLVPSAISNAVFQLTGVRLRQQPMLAERVRQAFAQQATKTA